MSLIKAVDMAQAKRRTRGRWRMRFRHQRPEASEATRAQRLERFPQTRCTDERAAGTVRSLRKKQPGSTGSPSDLRLGVSGEASKTAKRNLIRKNAPIVFASFAPRVRPFQYREGGRPDDIPVSFDAQNDTLLRCGLRRRCFELLITRS